VEVNQKALTEQAPSPSPFKSKLGTLENYLKINLSLNIQSALKWNKIIQRSSILHIFEIEHK
jgi:hypothetical protein